jgi:hypothetical protein
MQSILEHLNHRSLDIGLLIKFLKVSIREARSLHEIKLTILSAKQIQEEEVALLNAELFLLLLDR